jgi:hypothetical protein
VTEAELRGIEARVEWSGPSGTIRWGDYFALVAEVRRLIAIEAALSSDMRLLTREQERLLVAHLGGKPRGMCEALGTLARLVTEKG